MTGTLRNTAVFLALAFGSPALAQHYNLTDDFSVAQNPNGPWAYRISGDPIACQISSGELRGWGCFGSLDASITKIVAPPNSFPPDYDVQLNDVLMHVSSAAYPGPMSITWTAPSAGIVSISGIAWGAAFDPGRDAGWTLSLNGALLAAHDGIYGIGRSDAAAWLANNVIGGQSLAGLAVAAGDVVTFSTYRISFYGHFMGVDINIDLACASGASITSQPANAATCPSGTAPFSVTAAGTGPFTYQWQIQTAPDAWATLGIDPIPLACGGFALAIPPDTAATQIGITPCPGITAYPVRCIVSNACGSITSDPATLTVCHADYNCDGFVDGIDYDQFNNDFENPDPAQQIRADYNGDGFVDGIDYDLFNNDFEAGCP